MFLRFSDTCNYSLPTSTNCRPSPIVIDYLYQAISIADMMPATSFTPVSRTYFIFIFYSDRYVLAKQNLKQTPSIPYRSRICCTMGINFQSSFSYRCSSSTEYEPKSLNKAQFSRQKFVALFIINVPDVKRSAWSLCKTHRSGVSLQSRSYFRAPTPLRADKVSLCRRSARKIIWWLLDKLRLFIWTLERRK